VCGHSHPERARWGPKSGRRTWLRALLIEGADQRFPFQVANDEPQLRDQILADVRSPCPFGRAVAKRNHCLDHLLHGLDLVRLHVLRHGLDEHTATQAVLVTQAEIGDRIVVSLRNICPIPARRSGNRRTKGPATGEWSRDDGAGGEEGEIVLGNRTSATTPSLSSSLRRRSSSQLRLRVPPVRSLKGFEYRGRQSSNWSEIPRFEVGTVLLMVASRVPVCRYEH
jgi:hypothetical protein